MSEPKKKHIEAAYRILRYFKGIPGRRLFFRKHEQITVEVYTDADWRGTYPD